jgi:hypothetical protein
MIMTKTEIWRDRAMKRQSDGETKIERQRNGEREWERQTGGETE